MFRKFQVTRWSEVREARSPSDMLVAESGRAQMGHLSFLSSELPEGERIPAWSRLLSGSIVSGHLETIGPMPFNAELKIQRIASAVFAEASSSPVLYHHKRARHEPQEKQRVVLQTILDGEATHFEDRMGTWRSGKGALAVAESGQSGGFVCDAPVRIASLSLPRALVVPRFATAADFRRDLSGTLGARLLVDLIEGIARGSLAHARQTTIGDAVGGLLGLALEEARGECEDEHRIGAMRLSAIRDHIRAHYADSHLSPTAVAERFRISVRHLHRLMEATGRSFREELLAVRLEAARAQLFHRERHERTIADIAYTSGFSDLSHFNRQFRMRFDMTPGEARKRSSRAN